MQEYLEHYNGIKQEDKNKLERMWVQPTRPNINSYRSKDKKQKYNGSETEYFKKLMDDAREEIIEKRSMDLTKINKLFIELENDSKLPRAAIDIQRQLKSLQALHHQRTTGKHCIPGAEIDKAMRYIRNQVSKNIQNLMITEETNYDEKDFKIIQKYLEFYKDLEEDISIKI